MPLGKSVSSRGASGSLLKADDMGKCEVCEGSIEGSITPGTLDTSWPWISLRIPTDTASVFSASSDDASEVSTPRREDVTPRGVQGLQWPESASDRLESDIEDDMFVLSPTPSQVPSLQDELDPGGPHLPPWNAQRFRFWKVHMMAARSGGQVELYYDLMTGGSVAVKHLPRSRLRDSPQSYQEAWPGEVENPWKEIEIMMRFGMPGPEQLPGVCRSLGAFRTESGDGMLVSEYLPGGDLFDIAAKLGEPGYDREQQVYPIVISLIQAVRALHVRGIAHGDISLENALLRYGSQVVLIDFAMALKKRTTQLLDNLDKVKDGKGADGVTLQEPSIEIPFDPQVASALGCPDDSILVQYEVQNGEDKDREIALYSMPLGGAVSVTVGMVRSSFPPPGHYHFRFKAPTSDGSFGGWVWIDLASDQDFVPVYNGGIVVKALCLPDICGTARPGTSARSARASASAPSRSAGSAGGLMELDMSSKAAPGKAAPAPPKAKPLDRAQLVAERQARERREYEEKIKRHEEQKAREERSKKEKLELNDVLSKELNDWAKTPDGQSYKEIRTLLSTMHSVMWQGAGWKELSLSELVADSSIKKNYRKAILLAHPDRHQSASSEQQVRADRIFNALNESFKAFSSS